MRKFLSCLLIATLLMSLCAFTAHADGDPITDFVSWRVTANEMETFNILHSQGAVDLDVLTNCIDGLLTNDNYGALVPNAAESWGTDNGGFTWTFKLRDGLKWVDYQGNPMADVLAEDWLWGLEWVLNFWKNEAMNTSMPIEMIIGAKEYYDYTKGLTEEEGKALGLDLFKKVVGIEAVDDKTLVYACKGQIPYFATVATYNCLYPVSGQLLANLGVDGYIAVDNEKLWYSGPYTMTTYVHQNEKVLTKNPLWWNTEASRFDTVTVKMIESADVGFQLYSTGEIDQIDLGESNLQTIYRSESNEFHDYLVEARPTKYSYVYHLVYDKKLEDGSPDVNWNTAIANEAFRLSWYYGLDMTAHLSRINAINPLSCYNYCYTANNLVVKSDGTQYTRMVEEKLGLTPPADGVFTRYNPEKAAAYKAQAIEELTAKGVTFPIEIDYYFQAGNQNALDTANVLKQMFSDCLGDDYVDFQLNTYISSLAQEVRNPQLASLYVNGWGADYGDPQNFLGQETYGEDNAYYSVTYSKINNATDPDLIATYQEFTRLVNAAMAITQDLDARYDAYAEAEAYFLSKALVIPCYYNITWQLTCVNDYTRVYAPYGIQALRYVNWETSKDGYTGADYEAFKAAYEAK